MEKYTGSVLPLGFFLKCAELISSIAVIDFGLLNIEIWRIKKISLVVFYQKPPDFVKYLKYFLNCKIGLIESKIEFMQN